MPPQITPEEVKQIVASGKQYCLLLLKLGPNQSLDKAAIEKDQMEHLQYLLGLKRDGILPLFGPVTDGGDLRGIGIFTITDRGKIKVLMDADPHIKSGRLRYELYGWFGIPGDSLPN